MGKLSAFGPISPLLHILVYGGVPPQILATTSTESLLLHKPVKSNSADILLNGTVSAENNQIKNVADPTDAQDAATKSYIDSLIANLQSQIDQINSTQPQYDLTEGLVGYYPFDGNANDASGNGNNGTVSGATLTANKDAARRQ